jgi:hypothetical protein
MTELRKVQVKRKVGWRNCRLRTIKKGDVFRMFELDGIPIKHNNGCVIMKANCDAFFMEDQKTYGVDTDGIDSHGVLKSKMKINDSEI